MSSKNTILFQNEIEKAPDRGNGSAATDGGDDAAEKSNGMTSRLHKTTGKAAGSRRDRKADARGVMPEKTPFFTLKTSFFFGFFAFSVCIIVIFVYIKQ